MQIKESNKESESRDSPHKLPMLKRLTNKVFVRKIAPAHLFACWKEEKNFLMIGTLCCSEIKFSSLTVLLW